MKKSVIILFAFIINFFNPSFAIRIGLETNVGRIGVGSSVESSIFDINTNQEICTLEPMKGYEIKPFKNKIAIKYGDKYYKIDSNNVVLRTTGKTGFVSVKGSWYRGNLLIQNKNGKLTVINDVGIEDYVKGVVPKEMPTSWEPEAIKAQAIAARSWALANLGKRSSLGYDLNDTTDDQVYGGASAETSKTNSLCDATKGLVLIYDLKIIPAYYFASAGGQTINSSSAWGKDLPYIRSVPSFDDNVKKVGHGVGMSQHGANNLAKQGYNAYQILQYFYKNIRFARINPEIYP